MPKKWRNKWKEICISKRKRNEKVGMEEDFFDFDVIEVEENVADLWKIAFDDFFLDWVCGCRTMVYLKKGKKVFDLQKFNFNESGDLKNRCVLL